MIIKTDGIVIRENNTGEQDRLVTLLTRDKGIITAFVNGGRNPKNKNVAATGLLCYSDFSIEKTRRDVYIIKEATAKEVFFSLREDIRLPFPSSQRSFSYNKKNKGKPSYKSCNRASYALPFRLYAISCFLCFMRQL